MQCLASTRLAFTKSPVANPILIGVVECKPFYASSVALVLLNGMNPLLFTLTTAQWKQYRRPIQEREPSLKPVVSVQSSEFDDLQHKDLKEVCT